MTWALTDRPRTFDDLDGQRLNRDKSSRYRWDNDYELPKRYGGRTVTVRLHGNDQDAARGFNRTENVRPIPPSDDDFPALYARRNDADSINRGVEDSMYLRRAHSFAMPAST